MYQKMIWPAGVDLLPHEEIANQLLFCEPMAHKRMITWCFPARQHVGLHDEFEHRFLSACGFHVIGWVIGCVCIHNF